MIPKMPSHQFADGENAVRMTQPKKDTGKGNSHQTIIQ
jgi:hypothetical protein